MAERDREIERERGSSPAAKATWWLTKSDDEAAFGDLLDLLVTAERRATEYASYFPPGHPIFVQCVTGGAARRSERQRAKRARASASNGCRRSTIALCLMVSGQGLYIRCITLRFLSLSLLIIFFPLQQGLAQPNRGDFVWVS